MQTVLSAVVPTALLLSSRACAAGQGGFTGRDATPAAAAAPAAPPGSPAAQCGGAGEAADAKAGLLEWVERQFREDPLLLSLFSAQLVWVLLRAAAGMLLC